LYETHKQIVIASDRPPKQLQVLSDRLRSRLEWGIITDIKPPEIEHRMAIVSSWAREERLALSREATEHLASHVESNIRVLQGAFRAICARSSLVDAAVTTELIDEVLATYSREDPRPVVNLDRILDVVSGHFGVAVEDICGNKRSQNIVQPRHIAMYLARELTDASLAAIGHGFNGRDHSTVLHAVEKVTREVQEGDHPLFLINELRATLLNES
jgi:chromosomal replication initiator protein